MTKKQLKQLDAQLAHWAATDKQHTAQLKHTEYVRANDPLYQAEERRTDAWFKWYMENVNGR
jgi:hypothetical protein